MSSSAPRLFEFQKFENGMFTASRLFVEQGGRIIMQGEDRHMTVRIIDTETTGFSPAKGGETISIASIDLTRDLEATNPLKTLVRPTNKIPPETSAIHGIVDDDVMEAPHYGEALGRFQGADVYVAHNWEFDRQFLPGLIAPKVICTLKVAKRVFPDAPNHKNQTLRYMLGIIRPFGLEREEINPHDALSDVYVTGAILAHIIANQLATFQQMVEWTGQAPLMTNWPVGKHKGVHVEKVPPDYLGWVIDKSELGEDLKQAARAELERRQGGRAAA